MSTVTRTVQTALRGQALQNAVQSMVAGILSRSPYSMLSPRYSWQSATRMVLSAGEHMSGTVDLQDGNPSTVTATINLLSSLAEGQRSRVEGDLAAAASQLAPAGGQAGPAVTQDTRRAAWDGGGVDWAAVQQGFEGFMQALPGMVGQVRETAEQTAAAARGNQKPGMRPAHAPDVAEPTPMLRRAWVPWVAGGVVVLGVGYLLLRKQ